MSCTDLRTTQYSCFVIYLPMPLAARGSAASRFSEIVGSDPAVGMDVCLLRVLCVASVRSLVQRSPTECVYDIECGGEASKIRRSRPTGGLLHGKKSNLLKL